jgi:hypothetical protein
MIVCTARAIAVLIILSAATACSRKHSKTEIQGSKQADTTVSQTVLPGTDRYWNDVARYLGGLDPLPGSTLDSLEYLPEAEQHRRFFAETWPKVENERLLKFQKWAAAELGNEHTSTRTVLYPFSGADFLHVHTLFPNAQLYLMYGLEREGYLPDVLTLPPGQHAAMLRNIQQSLDVMLNMSFFRTKDMMRRFNQTELLTGTTPILLAFLARSGHEVLELRRIRIDNAGKAVAARSDGVSSQRPADGLVTGMEITFRKPGASAPQKLLYFSFDAQDLHVKSQPQLLAYFKSYGPVRAYFKSASYLMHWDTYSLIRDNILSVSDLVVQDDTGIALRKFPKGEWKFQLYGTYVLPVREFTSQFQRDLDALYKSDSTVKALDFGLGYHNELGRSNLMIARRVSKTS